MKLFVLPVAIAVAALISCQKQQTEAEKNAEVEKQVQERLAAEHQAEQQQQLQQRQADLDAREKALAEKENAAAASPAPREQAEPEREPVTRPRAVSPTRPTSGYSTFYTKLDPYGAWLETSDYGYVWQPREAQSSRSWRPYTSGHWVYTDAGWTWISEEPFGWATYHYGRWTRLRGVGWVWVPGNEWAGAWVSWRKSNDYVGWAPLPPEARFDQRTGIHNWSDSYYEIGPDQYCFVASREFGAQRVGQTLLPPERNLTIINQTTNVTNITYNNTTIVNEGPNYDELRAISREPVQRFRLERNVNVDVAGEPPRPEVRGETVVIAAPVIAAPMASERPPSVKQTIAAAAVDLGWEAIADHDAAKKAREKMKSEATPPPNAPPKKFVKVAATMSATIQANEAPATSTSAPSATAAPSAATTLTPVASAVSTATPQPKMTPRNAATVAPTSTPFARATPGSSAAISPTASQRRGRLLVPSATPSPRIAPSVTPRPAAERSPTPSDTIPSTQITPPSASQTATDAASQQQAPQGKFKSQAQRFNSRKIEPMPSASPAATVGSTSSPNAASTSLAEKWRKQENKEQQREEKKELKRERREGFQSASPSATP